MTKQQKMWLGVGVLALAAVAYFATKKKAQATTPQEGSGGSETTQTICPQGEVKCASSDKCYDPNANYLVDPCA